MASMTASFMSTGFWVQWSVLLDEPASQPWLRWVD